MKKTILIIGILLLLLAAWMVGSGMQYETSAYISDFSLSEDGSEVTITVQVASSMGYVRGYIDKGGAEMPHYLRFYSAWGGLNSAIGAKTRFVLPLNDNDTQIYVYHGDGSYTLALDKNSQTGEWELCR